MKGYKSGHTTTHLKHQQGPKGQMGGAGKRSQTHPALNKDPKGGVQHGAGSPVVDMGSHTGPGQAVHHVGSSPTAGVIDHHVIPHPMTHGHDPKPG